VSDVDEAREVYVKDVIEEREKAHDSSVRLLIVYRLLRIVRLSPLQSRPSSSYWTPRRSGPRWSLHAQRSHLGLFS
jgi:hypothetical protein